MTEIQQKAVELYKQIYDNDYYISLFITAMDQNEINCISGHTDLQIIDMFNHFWELLPDSMNIHRQPFQLLCDICASDYKED